MANSLRLLFSFALLLAVASADDIHDVLSNFGLPKGILPDSVVGFTLEDNGDFEVKLAAPCYVLFSDLTYFEKTIRGRLSYGTITDLSGIQVKKLFIWTSISDIQVDQEDNNILLTIGFIPEKHPMKEFEYIRHCPAADSSRRARWFLPEELLPLPVSQITAAINTIVLVRVFRKAGVMVVVSPAEIDVAMLEVFKQRGLVD